MKPSNTVLRLMKEYDIDAQGVYLAMLINQGVSQSEAYVAIFQPIATNIKALSNIYFSKNPQINNLISELKNETGSTQPQIIDIDQETVNRYKDKDYIISQLIEASRGLKGKELSDVLTKIADLQQMKKEETKSEEEKVHYYLPLTCQNCSLYINRNKE